MPRGQPRPLSQQAQRTHPKATISDRTDHYAVGTQGDGLERVVRGADAARGDQRHFVPDAFGAEELVNLRDCVLDGHRDVFLGDVRRGAGAAVAAVQVNDMSSRIVAAHGHHVHIGGRRYLHAHQAVAIHFLDPIEMLLVVFHAVDAVKGERAEQGVAGHGLAHARHGGRVLVAQQVPTQSGFGTLCVLELDDPHPLNGVLAHAEQAGGHLRDHMVVVGLETVVIAALAGAGERVPRGGRAGFAQNRVDTDRSKTHPSAIHGEVDMDLRPAIVAVVQVQSRVDVGARWDAGARIESRNFELKSQTVEPTARGPRPAFQVRRRGLSGGGLMPGRQNQIARPTRIAHALGAGVWPHGEGMLRAQRDAGLRCLGAGRADAELSRGRSVKA